MRHVPAHWAQKKRLISQTLLAVWTGLEPATPCVTGRYSNQLNYHTIFYYLQLLSIALQRYDNFLYLQVS